MRQITPPPGIDYFTGQDLGQVHEFTAFQVLERSIAQDFRGREYPAHYAVRHLERLPIGTPYAVLCNRLGTLFRDPKLAGSTLIVDRTVVGKPVLDLLLQTEIDAEAKRLIVTTGPRVTFEEGDSLVPKKDLVGALQLLLQSRQLAVAPSLQQAASLMQELTNLKAKAPTRTDDALADWRQGVHDDLVLAVAVAA
jgi:hypothetical protein